MRFLFLLCAILWGLTAPGQRPLKDYFRSQLIYTVILQGILFWPGYEGWTYRIAFAALTLNILWWSYWLAMRYCRALDNTGQVFIGAAGISAFLTGLTIHGIGHKFTFADYVNVAEGAILIALAVVLGLASRAFRRHDDTLAKVGLTLSVLWACLAAWSFGWPMHLHLEVWQRLNYVVPTCLVVGAFGWIGYRLRFG